MDAELRSLVLLCVAKSTIPWGSANVVLHGLFRRTLRKNIHSLWNVSTWGIKTSIFIISKVTPPRVLCFSLSTVNSSWSTASNGLFSWTVFSVGHPFTTFCICSENSHQQSTESMAACDWWGQLGHPCLVYLSLVLVLSKKKNSCTITVLFFFCCCKN